jgi:hypothetical protein
VIEEYGGRSSPDSIDEGDQSLQDVDQKKSSSSRHEERKGKFHVPRPPCMNYDCTGSMGNMQDNSHACSSNSFDNMRG